MSSEITSTMDYVSTLNSSMNNNLTSGNETDKTGTFRPLYIILAVLGVFGNLLVVYVILKHRKMQTVTNMYILNLSIIDALIMIGLLFRDNEHWPYGDAPCKAYLILTVVTDFAGVLQIGALSLDRCYALTYPIRSIKYRTVDNSVKACSVVWILSGLFSVPVIYFGQVKNNVCQVWWTDGLPLDGDLSYFIYSCTLGFLLPGIMITVAYIIILYQLGHMEFEDRTGQRTKRVSMFVVIIIGVYLILWLPYWSVLLYNAIQSSETQRNLITLISIVEYISYLHSAFNPILYVFINQNFKASIYAALICSQKPRFGNSWAMYRTREQTIDTINGSGSTKTLQSTVKNSSRGGSSTSMDVQKLRVKAIYTPTRIDTLASTGV